MARDTFAFSVTVPAGTPVADPLVTDLLFPEGDVTRIDLMVPPGPRGVLGFYLARSGQQVVPHQAGQWLIWDDRSQSLTFSDLPMAGGWQLVAYNTGQYDHTPEVTFHTDPIPKRETGRFRANPPLVFVEKDLSGHTVRQELWT